MNSLATPMPDRRRRLGALFPFYFALTLCTMCVISRPPVAPWTDIDHGWSTCWEHVGLLQLWVHVFPPDSPEKQNCQARVWGGTWGCLGLKVNLPFKGFPKAYSKNNRDLGISSLIPKQGTCFRGQSGQQRQNMFPFGFPLAQNVVSPKGMRYVACFPLVSPQMKVSIFH